jgi:hypothetical protein
MPISEEWDIGDGFDFCSIEVIPRQVVPAPPIPPVSPRQQSLNERGGLIAQALDTEEGRIALATAMVEPIRRSLDYQGIGRRLLTVDELPQGALARYERDINTVSNRLETRTRLAENARLEIQRTEDESIFNSLSQTQNTEVIVPTFEIATNPTIRLSAIQARRFGIVDRKPIVKKRARKRTWSILDMHSRWRRINVA